MTTNMDDVRLTPEQALDVLGTMLNGLSLDEAMQWLGAAAGGVLRRLSDKYGLTDETASYGDLMAVPSLTDADRKRAYAAQTAFMAPGAFPELERAFDETFADWQAGGAALPQESGS